MKSRLNCHAARRRRTLASCDCVAGAPAATTGPRPQAQQQPPFTAAHPPVLITRPHPASIMAGRAALVAWKGAFKITAMICIQYQVAGRRAGQRGGGLSQCCMAAGGWATRKLWVSWPSQGEQRTTAGWQAAPDQKKPPTRLHPPTHPPCSTCPLGIHAQAPGIGCRPA